MMGYEVENIKASQSALDGARVLTLRLRYPRIVLAEFNTHKDPSRNTSSSRAIPVAKMLAQVRNDPAMPARFGANQAGMQDKGEEHNAKVTIPFFLQPLYEQWLCTHSLPELEDIQVDPRVFWRFMAWVNSLGSEAYSDAGFHKQIGNRLTEAYQWTNQLVTCTDKGWENFLYLRDHKDADPTIAKLARMVREVRDAAIYTLLQEGEWHLPYELDGEKGLALQTQKQLSTARCARVSYEPFDGNASHAKEIERHNLLVNSVPAHASPTEHLCTPCLGRHGNFDGWKQYRQELGI